MQILAVVAGRVEVIQRAPSTPAVTLSAGEFCLVPACVSEAAIKAHSAATLLRVECGEF
jgi:hypothetical protein